MRRSDNIYMFPPPNKRVPGTTSREMVNHGKRQNISSQAEIFTDPDPPQTTQIQMYMKEPNKKQSQKCDYP